MVHILPDLTILSSVEAASLSAGGLVPLRALMMVQVLRWRLMRPLPTRPTFLEPSGTASTRFPKSWTS